MHEAPLLHKDTEQLRVKEVAEEGPLGNWNVLEEQMLVEEEGGIARALGGRGEEGAKTHPVREKGRVGGGGGEGGRDERHGEGQREGEMEGESSRGMKEEREREGETTDQPPVVTEDGSMESQEGLPDPDINLLLEVRGQQCQNRKLPSHRNRCCVCVCMCVYSRHTVQCIPGLFYRRVQTLLESLLLQLLYQDEDLREGGRERGGEGGEGGRERGGRERGGRERGREGGKLVPKSTSLWREAWIYLPLL